MRLQIDRAKLLDFCKLVRGITKGPYQYDGDYVTLLCRSQTAEVIGHWTTLGTTTVLKRGLGDAPVDDAEQSVSFYLPELVVILNACSSDHVVIESAEKGMVFINDFNGLDNPRFVISSVKGTYESWSTPPFGHWVDRLEISGPGLAQIVSYAHCSTDDNRPAIKTIYVEPMEGVARFTSTDGSVLLSTTVDTPGSMVGAPFMIPPELHRLVSRVFAPVKGLKKDSGVPEPTAMISTMPKVPRLEDETRDYTGPTRPAYMRICGRDVEMYVVLSNIPEYPPYLAVVEHAVEWVFLVSAVQLRKAFDVLDGIVSPVNWNKSGVLIGWSSDERRIKLLARKDGHDRTVLMLDAQCLGTGEGSPDSWVDPRLLVNVLNSIRKLLPKVETYRLALKNRQIQIYPMFASTWALVMGLRDVLGYRQDDGPVFSGDPGGQEAMQ